MRHGTIGSMVMAALAATTPAHAGAPASAEALAPAPPASPQEIIDAVDAAASQWARSCKKADAEGLCVTRAVPKPSAKRCAEPLLGRVTVHPRNAKQAERAQAGFDRALRRAEHVAEPLDDATRTAYREAVARARRAKADLDLERYLAITMPTGLEFFVEEWKHGSGVPKWEKEYEQQVRRKEDSVARFKEYFERKSELGRQLHADYGAIGEAMHPRWSLEHALRTAWVSVDMADQLRMAPIPKSVLQAPGVRDAYCDALASQAEAPLQHARQAARYCVDRAAEAGLTGPTVDACRELLGVLPSAPQ